MHHENLNFFCIPLNYVQYIPPLLKGDDNFTFESANQLYVQRDYQLTEQFQSEMEQHFGAPAQSVDFRDFAVEETRAKINKWVQDFTHDKIKEILPQGRPI